MDGGVATQVFFYGDIINLDDAVRAAGLSSIGTGRIYIIQNIQSVPRYERVESNLVEHLQKDRSWVFYANQGNGDLYRIYTLAQREGIKFKLVFIPSDFELKPSELFDPEVMEKLFDLGYHMTLSGDPWKNHPPGYIGIGDNVHSLFLSQTGSLEMKVKKFHFISFNRYHRVKIYDFSKCATSALLI